MEIPCTETYTKNSTYHFNTLMAINTKLPIFMVLNSTY